MDNFYKILGVAENATDADIKKAYRALAKQYHPDKNQGNADAEKRFKQIGEAYDVLKDPAKKQEYDRQLNFKRGGAGRFTNKDRFDFTGSDFDIDEILQTLRRNQQHARPRDVEVPYQITLEDVLYGKDTEITYVVPGIGKKSAKIVIAPGIEDGMKIRYQGAAGSLDPMAAPSDLYVVIKISPHPAFVRNGSDLFHTVVVDALDAMLGSEVIVSCIDGTILKVKVPIGVQYGQKLRIKGRGLPRFRSNERGDMFLVFDIKIPSGFTDEQKSLLHKVKELNKAEQRG